MPPVPVHSSSPISSTVGRAADGTAPSTAADEPQFSKPGDGQRLVAVPAATTGPAPLITPIAQPGASAGPAVTSAATPTTSRYIPTPTVPPSSTQTLSSPPPPQPGAAPSPFQAHPTQSDPGRPSVPPPPKAGEIPKPTSYYAPQYESTPTATPTFASPALPPLPYHQQQTNISTPRRGQPPASLTSTSQDLSHPPGYVQDSRASFEERPIDPYQPFVNRTNHKRTPSRSNGGILDDSPENRHRTEEEEGILGEAVSWAKKIGGKVIEGEEALWKRINGEN